MPREKINCVDILRLHEARMSQDAIARTIHASKKSVSNVIKAASALGIRYSDVYAETNESLHARLFPEQVQKQCCPDMKKLHCALAVPGNTLKSEWNSFRIGCETEGRQAVGYSTMCLAYDSFVKNNGLLDHVSYKYGGSLLCSWAGKSITISDMPSVAYAFIGILPASGHVYTELTETKDEDTFLRCLGHMLYAIGGTVRYVGVVHGRQTGAKRLSAEEFVVTDKLRDLGAYYGADIRFYTENSNLDNLSKELFERIDSSMPLRDVMLAIQRWCVSKNVLSESAYQTEKTYLTHLPAKMYDVISRHKQTLVVQQNSHIKYHRNYYSVPYVLRGKTVKVQYTDRMVEIVDDDVIIAVHDRFPAFVANRYATDRDHMPPPDRRPFSNKDSMLRQSSVMGTYVKQVVEGMFARAQYEEQAYNTVQLLLALGRKISAKRLNDACLMALKTRSTPSYKYISELLKSE